MRSGTGTMGLLQSGMRREQVDHSQELGPIKEGCGLTPHPDHQVQEEARCGSG